MKKILSSSPLCFVPAWLCLFCLLQWNDAAAELYIIQPQESIPVSEEKRMLADMERLDATGHKQEALDLGHELIGWYKKNSGDELAIASLLSRLAHDQQVVSGRATPRTQARAEPLFREALAIYDKLLGPNHYQSLKTARSLAMVYSNLDRYTECIPLFDRWYHYLLRSNSPRAMVMPEMSNLAYFYKRAGFEGKAKKLMEEHKALEKRK